MTQLTRRDLLKLSAAPLLLPLLPSCGDDRVAKAVPVSVQSEWSPRWARRLLFDLERQQLIDDTNASLRDPRWHSESGFEAKTYLRVDLDKNDRVLRVCYAPMEWMLGAWSVQADWYLPNIRPECVDLGPYVWRYTATKNHQTDPGAAYDDPWRIHVATFLDGTLWFCCQQGWIYRWEPLLETEHPDILHDYCNMYPADYPNPVSR